MQDKWNNLKLIKKIKISRVNKIKTRIQYLLNNNFFKDKY